MSEENLTKTFPISFRWIFKQIIPWVISFYLVLYLIYLFESFMNHDFSDMIYRFSFYLGIIILLARSLYLFLFRNAYEYKIIGDEIIITRGILLKKPVGIPINKITAIHLNRSILDYIFGTSTLVLVVPGDLNSKLSSISGMTVSTAEGFKKLIFTKN